MTMERIAKGAPPTEMSEKPLILSGEKGEGLGGDRERDDEEARKLRQVEELPKRTAATTCAREVSTK